MEKELMKFIDKWIQLNEQLREVNKYLFDHTELFERKYTSDFRTDLHRFFAGKITRYGRDFNELYKKLDDQDRKELQKIKILERR